MTRIYLAGPMSGLPSFNYPAFNAEARRLRALGYHVENPAEAPRLPTWGAYMRLSIAQLLTCNVLLTLPGWQQSRGASIEVRLAQDLGIPVGEAAQLVLPSQ